MEKNRKSHALLLREARIRANSNSGKTGQVKKYILFAAFLVLIAFASVAQNGKAPVYNNVDASGVILDGYDAVGFFTDNKPVKGDQQFSATYEGATYYFASASNRDLFNANPEKYKPQFGGWCAYAVSLGRDRKSVV
jgi:YHS domain-containing protein